MKITNVSQVPLEQVQMPGAEGCSYRVAICAKDGAPNFAMRIFEVAPGGHTPLHQHPYEHEVFIMEGQGTVWREGQEVALKPSDVLFVPADERHQFKNTGAGVLKFMCLIPAQFQKC
jgi:quercetin dioxygenase-like cupin family protein